MIEIDHKIIKTKFKNSNIQWERVEEKKNKENSCIDITKEIIKLIFSAQISLMKRPIECLWISLVAQMIKNPPAMQETWVQSLGGEDPQRKEWQPTPVFLPGEIPWTEEPGKIQSMGSQTAGYDWAHIQAGSAPITKEHKLGNLTEIHILTILEAKKSKIKIPAGFSFWWKVSFWLVYGLLCLHLSWPSHGMVSG